MAREGMMGPEAVDVHVGAQLRERRKILGMTQTMLADALGVTFQQVQKYERGANRVSASMLARAAGALSCRVADFFPGEGDAPRYTLDAIAGGSELSDLFVKMPQAKRQLLLGLARELAA